MCPPPLTTLERSELLSPVEAATRSLSRLESRVEASPLKDAWHARARIHGVARMLQIGGVPITPAEFFRGLVGLVEPSSWPHYDWRALSVVNALFDEQQPVKGAVGQLLSNQFGSGHLVPTTWLDELDAYRDAAGTAWEAWDSSPGSLVEFGLALHRVLRAPIELAWRQNPQLDHVYRMTGWQPETPWTGWLLAPRMAGMIAEMSGGPPLPCLVPLKRSMRFTTARPIDTVRAFLDELEAQAAVGMSLLERQEDCALAWKRRLGVSTKRSRLGAAAAALLVTPIVTRRQLAGFLGTTLPGAGDLIDRLIGAGILRAHVLSPRVIFYVAEESLGDFKVIARQGRQSETPQLSRAPGGLDELASAIADLDRLLGSATES